MAIWAPWSHLPHLATNGASAGDARPFLQPAEEVCENRKNDVVLDAANVGERYCREYVWRNQLFAPAAFDWEGVRRVVSALKRGGDGGAPRVHLHMLKNFRGGDSSGGIQNPIDARIHPRGMPADLRQAVELCEIDRAEELKEYLGNEVDDLYCILHAFDLRCPIMSKDKLRAWSRERGGEFAAFLTPEQAAWLDATMVAHRSMCYHFTSSGDVVFGAYPPPPPPPPEVVTLQDYEELARRYELLRDHLEGANEWIWELHKVVRSLVEQP